MDENELDATVVIQILRQELAEAHWRIVLLRAKLAQQQTPSTPERPVG